MKAYCCALLLVTLVSSAPGYDVEFSSGGYVEFQRPDPDKALNIILTAPHGGFSKPAEMPDRSGGCLQNDLCIWQYDCGTPSSSCRVTTVLDTRSQEMTRAVADVLEKITGKRPYVVINLLSRRKADMNRPIGEATLNFPAAVDEYNAFHSFISESQEIIRATSSGQGRGILFDIHSVGSHSENWLELGYRISKSNLNSGDYSQDDSSIATLAHDTCGYNLQCFKQLLYGPNSLGGLLQDQGIKVIPSPQYNTPGSGGYYRGGYIVQTHGALEQEGMDAIQVEIPRPLRLTSNYLDTANKIGIAINEYVDLHYN